ncbi:unnamed protein product [Lymnaea stagnalis]|uniref:Fucosyltransferase n=1 Tax=Lymnaea stagnalis TaxID=6523 RepID=A0AAV2IT35_LYMST
MWKEKFANKTKMVAWFVSHCNIQSRREEYAAELSKYIQVDVYGKCGKLKCEDRGKCARMLDTEYKFYLSFENSFCVDYVTEKLLNILEKNTLIPVVRGGADYKKLFPPNSVIDTKDFSSPKDLAKYLTELANNEEEYVKKLQWSWDYDVLGYKLPLCAICRELHTPRPLACVYDNVTNWWFNGTCYPPRDLTFNV